MPPWFSGDGTGASRKATRTTGSIWQAFNQEVRKVRPKRKLIPKRNRAHLPSGFGPFGNSNADGCQVGLAPTNENFVANVFGRTSSRDESLAETRLTTTAHALDE